MKSISVLCHLFYENSLELLKPHFDHLMHYDAQFYFNVCSETDYYQRLAQQLKEGFNNPVITVSPNVGKDIGGKLVLLDTYIKLDGNSDYLILLHDKISPHTSTGDAWRNKLLTIIESQNIETILGLFENSHSIGLIGSRNFIMNEFDRESASYKCTNNDLLNSLRKEYNITVNNHQFLGGTMFWVRAGIYQQFFSKFKPLEIRSTLEKGNILDHHKPSVTHAWERMLSWVVWQQGFKVKGI